MAHSAMSLSPEAFVAPKSFHEQACAERVPPAVHLAARPLVHRGQPPQRTAVAGTAESFSNESAGLKFCGSYLHSSPSPPVGNLVPLGKQSKRNNQSAKSEVHHPHHWHWHHDDWCKAASFPGRARRYLGNACPSVIGMIIGPHCGLS